jgi:hypothetical protein
MKTTGLQGQGFGPRQQEWWGKARSAKLRVCLCRFGARLGESLGVPQRGAGFRGRLAPFIAKSAVGGPADSGSIAVS